MTQLERLYIMNTYLILTVIADDRPGLVDSLAATIGEHSGNWLESNMSQLAGKFAGILRIGVAADAAESLVVALHALAAGDSSFKLVVERVDAQGDVIGEALDESAAARQHLEIELVANDRPGIISEISRVLASLSVNVEYLTTLCEPAPMSGEPLFRAHAELSMPSTLLRSELSEKLEQLADDLMVEILD